jgi:hypothetical protein
MAAAYLAAASVDLLPPHATVVQWHYQIPVPMLFAVVALVQSAQQSSLFHLLQMVAHQIGQEGLHQAPLPALHHARAPFAS